MFSNRFSKNVFINIFPKKFLDKPKKIRLRPKFSVKKIHIFFMRVAYVCIINFFNSSLPKALMYLNKISLNQELLSKLKGLG